VGRKIVPQMGMVSQVTNLKFWGTIISLEQLKLQSLNYVQM